MAPSEVERARAEIARLECALVAVQGELADTRSARWLNTGSAASAASGGDERVRETLDHLLEGCQILGFDYRYLYINDAAERHNRRPKSELLGRTYMESWEGIEQTRVFRLIRECVEQRSSSTIENAFTFPDGELGHFELRIEPVPDGVFILSINITARHQAERERESLRKQLVQAQTMEAIGRLSGGLAHDFNNMLAVVLTQSEIVLAELGPGHALAEDMERIREAARHSAALTDQLLAFARQQSATPRVIDLNATISKLLNMLRRLLGENITLRFEPGEALWPLYMDPSHVGQLLVNLAVNARDAISDTGHITVSTANLRNTEVGGAIASGSECVRLTVEDDGSGMTAEAQERMFEPFFTTKAPGKGTGLGLATVYGVAKQNRAHIRVWSELGRGTRITIELPRYSGETADARAVASDAVEPVGRPPEGTETILIVEDEPVILHVTQRVVRGLGYKVLTAGSAQAALALSESHPGPIDLLLTDVIMPGMNGRDLAALLRAKRPDLCLLYMSGYTDDLIAHHGVLDPGVELLQKPFTRSMLAARLRQILDRSLTAPR